MRRRLLAFSVLLSIAAIIVTSVLVTAASYRDFFAAIKQEVKAETEYVRLGYELAGQDYIERLDLRNGHRVTLISFNGAVIYDSARDDALMDNHNERPEVRAARVDGAGESTRYSDTVRKQTYYYAVRLENGSILRMSSTTASILNSYDGIFWIVALIAVGVFAVSIAVASLVTRLIVRPINAIDLDNPENNIVYDELLPLLKRIKEQRGLIEGHIRELDRGRREFAAITESMNEGFLVLGRSGNVLSYNKSAMRLLGTVGAAGGNILALNRSEAFRAAVQLALAGETEERIVELSGRRCEMFANPVVEDGAVQGVILLLMDVTEKQERDKLRREFTANVSHELKTPLTVISGYAEIMANGVARAQDVPEFSQKIYREAGRLIALVNDLMLLSGLEENASPPMETLDLRSLAEDVAHRLAPKAAERGVALAVTDEAAEIMGNPTVLEEMLYNLLDNAIKYNREGGTASIEIAREDGAVVLYVVDTGVGIPRSEHERIFERFYRVDKSRNKAVGGTGLGLSIVKHGAIMHDALLELVSDEGVGTTVKVWFAGA